jgi:DNA-directed RNA polymerase specialized sigma24 family protein
MSENQRVSLVFGGELNLEVLCILGVLTERQRECFVDYYVLEQTPLQISKRLGISCQAVNAHTSQALKKVRKELKDRECGKDLFGYEWGASLEGSGRKR